MSQNIKVELTVEELQALNAWKNQASAIRRMQAELKKLQSGGADVVKVTDQIKKSTMSAVKQITTMAAGYLSAVNAARTLMAVQTELQNKGRDLGITFDEAFRKFNIQGGLQGPAADLARTSIERSAVKLSMDPIEVAGIAEQLVSSGFSPEQASGASLESFLKLMAGTNQAMSARGEGAVSTKDLVQAVSSYMENLKLDKTAASIDRFAVVAQTAFKKTNLQLEDFAALAPEAAVLKDLLPLEQQVAIMSAIRDTDPSGAESATSLRNIALRTSTITEPTRIAALAQANLKPEEIDGTGENFLDGLKKLRAGLEKLPEEQRRKVAKVMYEERGVAPFMTLMQPGVLEEIDRRAKDFQDRATYEKDVITATSGKSAQARRLKAEEDIRLSRLTADKASPQEIRTAMRAEAVSRGMGETEAAFRDFIAQQVGTAGELVGLDYETGAKQAFTQRLVPEVPLSVALPFVDANASQQQSIDYMKSALESVTTESFGEAVKQRLAAAADPTIAVGKAKEIQDARQNLESFIKSDTNITPNDERLYLRQAKDLDQQAKKLGMNSSATDANTKAIRELVEVQKKTLELAQKQISGGGRQQKPPPPPSSSPPVRRAPGMAALQTKGSFNRGVN